MRDKAKDIRIITNAAKTYKEKLASTTLMYIYYDSHKEDLSLYEVNFFQSNFQHLTGVVSTDPELMKPEQFYNAAINSRLKKEEFEYKDKTSYLKLDNLEKGILLPLQAKMIGDYIQNTKYLTLDKIAGSVKLTLGFDLIKKKEIAYPKTFLIGDIRDKVVGKANKVICILGKHIAENKYDKILYTGKDIEFFNLKLTDEIKNKIDFKNIVFDKSINKIPSQIAIENMISEAGYTPTEKLITDIHIINKNIKEIHSIEELKEIFNTVNKVVEDFKEQELLEIAADKTAQNILNKNFLEKE